MKKLALAGATAALLAVPAFAQHAGPMPAQPMTRAAVQERVQIQFARVDTNRDGFITEAEVQAMAAQRQAKRAERVQKNGQRRANVFERLDADRNGAITQAEAQAVAAKRQAPEQRRANLFARLDANRDGSITRAEFDAAAAQRVQRRGLRGAHAARLGGRLIERADADKDGRISLAEFTARRLAHFDRLDANRDGTVTIEERRAARAQRKG